MEYQFLGETDLNISRIGFGTWGISGDWEFVTQMNIY